MSALTDDEARSVLRALVLHTEAGSLVTMLLTHRSLGGEPLSETMLGLIADEVLRRLDLGGRK